MEAGCRRPIGQAFLIGLSGRERKDDCCRMLRRDGEGNAIDAGTSDVGHMPLWLGADRLRKYALCVCIVSATLKFISRRRTSKPARCLFPIKNVYLIGFIFVTANERFDVTSCLINTMTKSVVSRRAIALIMGASFGAIFAAPSRAAADEVTVNRVTPPNTPVSLEFSAAVVNCAGVSDAHISHPVPVVAPEHPLHGELRIFEGQARIRRCGGQWGNATIVLYTPEHNFVGSDSFKIRVLANLRDHTESRQFAAHIQVGGAGKPKR